MSWTIPTTTRMAAMIQSNVALMCASPFVDVVIVDVVACVLLCRGRRSAGEGRTHGPYLGIGERVVGRDLRQVQLAVEQVTAMPGLAGVQRHGLAVERDAPQLRRVGEAWVGGDSPQSGDQTLPTANVGAQPGGLMHRL